MILRALRSHMQWIFFLLVVIPFVGWLVFGVGGLTSREYGTDVVLKVDGQEVHAPAYQARLQAAYEQYRRQNGSGVLTREEEQQIGDQLVDQLVQELLLHEEYGRLGITVSDQEVIEAARTSPPPEVMTSPQFQTNGQFDITKWQRFLATGMDPQFLSQLEGLYRERIPQAKLAQYLAADVYVPDAKLWRVYRDQHDSVTVAVLAVRATMMPDSQVPVSDADLEHYVKAHEKQFTRPAVAYLRFVAVPRWPDHADSAAALERVRRLRAEIVRGTGGGIAKFAEVAKRESADSTSGRAGGELGWLKRDEPGFDPQFLQGMRRLAPGQLSEPVLSTFGYHLIRVDSVRGDSVKARHILVPIELHGEHLDRVEARADSLDRLAAEQTDGRMLDTAARKLDLPLSPTHRLVEGDRMLLGRYVIPDVSVWAFETHPGETSPVIEAKPAYYVFRLDSVTPAGLPPLAEIREEVAAAVRLEKKTGLVRQRAEQIAAELRGTPSLLAAGRARGYAVERYGPFTRLNPPGMLQREPLVVGAAFGLRVGERSGAIEGESGAFLVESLARKLADSTAWAAQKDAQRQSLLQAARQARIQGYLSGLRERAKIVDRRKEVFRAPAAG